MFNKKLQKFSIRKLTVGAASVLIGISFVSMRDNNTVHAADMPVATTAQTSSASSAIEAAQAHVNSAQTNLNKAQSNLNDAQQKAAQADKAYEEQAYKEGDAAQKATVMKKALDTATSKVADAQKAVDNANKPGVKEAAKKNVADNEAKLKQAQSDEQLAQLRANNAKHNIADATQDVNSKQSNVNAKQADKNKADADVKAAQDALKGTGVEEASKALSDANNKVSQDQTNLKNADKAVDQATQDKNKSDKNLADVQSVVDKANKDQQNAQTDYEAKKQASDEANKPVVEKQNEKDQLQKQLDDLKDKSKNNIVISDVDRFKQAYAYAMQHDEMMSDADAAWSKEENSKNHFISSEADKKEIVDPGHLTDAQVEELSLFISDLESKVRAQLGFGPDQVTKGSIEFVKAIAQRYAQDYDDGSWKPGWHDATGINDVSKEFGLDSNESSDRNVWQNYEDLGEHYSYYFKDKSVTMDQLKEEAYSTLLDMILPASEGNVAPGESGFEMGHTRGVINIKYDENSNKVVDQLTPSPLVNAQVYYANKNLENYKTNLQKYQNLLENGPVKSDTIYTTTYEVVSADRDGGNVNQGTTFIVEISVKDGKSTIDVLENNSWKTVSEDELKTILPRFIKNCEDTIPQLEQEANKYDKLAQEDLKNRSISSATSFSFHSPFSDDEYGSYKYLDVHFINVNPDDIEDTSKFSTEIIPSYEDQIANVTKQLETANQELVDLQAAAKSKNDATAQAKQVLDKAQNAVQASQQTLNNAQIVNNNAQNLLSKAQKTQAQLQNKLSNDQNDQKAKQAVYDKLTVDQKQKADILNASLAAQTKAANALKDAQNALASAQSELDKAKQVQSNLNNDVSAKTKVVQEAQTALNKAKQYLANLNNAPQMLAVALSSQKQAQSDYDNAKKDADKEAQKLKNLTPAKDAADEAVAKAETGVKDAQQELSNAESELASAQSAYEASQIPVTNNSNSKETPMTGVAHIKNSITLVNGKGEAVSQTINAETNYKVFAKKTINGKTYYRLGTDNQWVVEDAVSSITDGVPAKSNTEESFAAHGYIPVLKSHPTWKIALVDGNGNYTGQYLPTNTKWKVFAKKTINGQTYYRLGTDQQWIPANFLQVKKTGVVKANPVKNHPTWKIALLNQNGEYTGKFVKPNTSWKVLDVEFINGRMMARIGNQAQWIPMDYVAWVK
ncbi:SEC10/PgrA surface exclusion domain-containing protein [Lactobacillus sp. PV034]|uniref:SEC10/PgrA surface exclusion domain-containing protein n=1 Tax=Lactobacillus sp. PV034 TaxID=2594495 RepID=UPI002240AFF9|nr:SEC10/PgrA surface exclusion domain-containing protein [Lactobacillus sp. PV034]QNQ80206.1 SEC10/PgrA surface exclusion domain-containing protein [Lactobacillus sp. PV034]